MNRMVNSLLRLYVEQLEEVLYPRGLYAENANEIKELSNGVFAAKVLITNEEEEEITSLFYHVGINGHLATKDADGHNIGTSLDEVITHILPKA
jgi:hypothetical protein